jgi:type II secretory pathway component HofQ
MIKTEIVLCVRYVVLLAFMIPVLFGCAAPEIERDVAPAVVEEHTTPSLMNQKDSAEIMQVPLLVGAEEALQERELVKADITTVHTKNGATHQEELIIIRCQNTDLLDVLEAIARVSGLTLVVHPGISGTVTVRLENVSWKDALDNILMMNNLRYAIEGTVLRIFPPSAS